MKKKILLFALLLLGTVQASFAYYTYGQWRWRNDNGTETSATWKAATYTPIEITDLSTIRLRFEMVFNTNDAGDGSLRYRESGASADVGITNDATTNAFVMVSSSNANVIDGMATTKQLVMTTTYSGYTFLPGVVRSNANSIYYTSKPNHVTEQEYVIKPTANIKAGKTYTFSFGDYGISGNKPYLTTAATLPVKLTEFTATLQQSGLLKANWKTASETNNSHFILQSSADGKVWKDLVRKAAAPNDANGATYQVETNIGDISLAGFALLAILLLPLSNKRYRSMAVIAVFVLFAASCAKSNELDQIALGGAKTGVNGTLYLRLAQVDLDGTTTYSHPLPVKAN